jgi:hypothetical protein
METTIRQGYDADCLRCIIQFVPQCDYIAIGFILLSHHAEGTWVDHTL